MWRSLRLQPWQAWTAGPPPDQRALHGLRERPCLVALLGSSDSDARGRYGIVGIPSQIVTLEPGPGVIARSVDARPKHTLRVLLLSYELGYPEVYLPAPKMLHDQPAGLIADLGAFLIVDHADKTYAFGDDGSEAGRRSRQELEQAASASLPAPTHAAQIRSQRQNVLSPAVGDEAHQHRIGQIQASIGKGQIYQANLTRRLRVLPPVDGPELAIALQRFNPVSHGAFLRWGGMQVVSNSMETLLHTRDDGCLTSYPIKGTFPRTAQSANDVEVAAALTQHPKERAEHVMIVDLVRNDFGRIAVPGSVRVPHLMRPEPYRGVMHGVSEIEARLADHHSLGEAVAALFPGGSITGAPKRRAMRLLRGLEQESRGFYTGSLGLLTPAGYASFSILIRTLVHDNNGWSLSVGGGIVTDSVPQREVDETWHKVAVFQDVLRSLG